MRYLPLALLLAACGRDRDSDVAADCDPTVPSVALPDFHADVTIRHIEIAPSAIDPLTDGYPESIHQIYLPEGIPLRDELFVFLPGTDNRAQAFDALYRVAAKMGYPVIGLAYDSSTHHASYCTAGTEEEIAACRTDAIAEKMYGVDRTEAVDWDEPNSIVGRTKRLLAAIHAQYPEAGADRYLEGDEVAWDRIVVSGFSQGAIMAGFLSKDEAVARAALLAGGCDTFVDADDVVHLAPWCTEARATPPDRTFALMHSLDEPEEDTLVHEAFGLPALGDYADAPTQSPSYCTATHLLRTDLPSDGDRDNAYHLSVAQDGEIPLDAEGVPVLAEDYGYLFGEAR